MRAGLLRQRVTLQEKTVTRNEFNEEIISWSDWATVWASVEDLSGREFLEAERAGAEVRTRIRMRYRSGVLEEMRAVWGSRTFEVKAVLEADTKHRELHLMCKGLV